MNRYTKLCCAARVCTTCGCDPEAIYFVHWAMQLMLCPSGSSDKWTNQTSDQRSHIQVPWLCMEIRPSPCLCIDESTSVSSPTSAWDFPQVAWHFIGKYFHLQHIIYCSLSLARSLRLLHTGSGSGRFKLPSWVNSEHTLAQKMDSHYAKNANQITSILSPVSLRLPPALKRKDRNPGL